MYIPIISKHTPLKQEIFFDPIMADAKGMSAYKAVVQAEVITQRKRTFCQLSIPITNNSKNIQHLNKGMLYRSII